MTSFCKFRQDHVAQGTWMHTFGGNSRTSLLIRRKKYGLNRACSCFTSSSSSSSCCFSRASRSFHSSGSRKFIRLNSSRMLLFKGVYVGGSTDTQTEPNECVLTPVIIIRCALFSSFNFLKRRLPSLLTKPGKSIHNIHSMNGFKPTSLAFVNNKNLQKISS